MNTVEYLSSVTQVGANALVKSVVHSDKENSIIAQYENVSTTVKLRGKEVKVHGISTGTVAVKRNFKTKKGPGFLAKINIFLDQYYTEYLPIWIWVIEHPAGLIVIDTGEIEAMNDSDSHLKNESFYNRFSFKNAAKFAVKAEEELNKQFDKLGLRIDDVNLVVLTHLHLDHTDGLKFFSKTEIIVNEFEFKHPSTNMPTTYPHWFKPNKVSLKKNQIEIFDEAFAISNNLFYVPTPGHTLGHCSVIFKTDDFDIIFAGDTSYTQSQMQYGILAGVNADFKKSLETYDKLKKYSQKRPTIYLPSHDARAGERLENLDFVPSLI